MPFVIGCHLSSAKGYLAMGKQAESIGANTFQFFTRNPRGGSVKPYDPVDASELNAFLESRHFGPILAHAPYTLNACSADPAVRNFAFRAFREDLQRLEGIPSAMLNFHPGSHVGQGIDAGIRLIDSMLDEVLTSDTKTPVLLETMAGKGSEVGSKFEELRRIIDGAAFPEKIGVCLDTCHVYDAGYAITEHLDAVLEQFDSVIGLNKLKAIHLNDSKNPLGSHKDRHEKIGKGHIGLESLVELVCHPSLRSLPFYLETPNELDGYAQEIALLREEVHSRLKE